MSEHLKRLTAELSAHGISLPGPGQTVVGNAKLLFSVADVAALIAEANRPSENECFTACQRIADEVGALISSGESLPAPVLASLDYVHHVASLGWGEDGLPEKPVFAKPGAKLAVPIKEPTLTSDFKQAVFRALGMRALGWGEMVRLLAEMGAMWKHAKGTGDFTTVAPGDQGYAVAASWRDYYAKLLAAVAVGFGLENGRRFGGVGVPANHLDIAAKVIGLMAHVTDLNESLRKKGYGAFSTANVFERIKHMVIRNEALMAELDTSHKELAEWQHLEGGEGPVHKEPAAQPADRWSDPVAAPAEATESVPALTFTALREANIKRCPAFGHTVQDWSIERWFLAFVGEVGELGNLLKKEIRGDKPSESGNDVEIGFEMADAIIYLDLLAEKRGINLGAMVARKFNIVSGRVKSTVLLPYSEA